MNTIQTTTYEYGVDGRVLKQTVTREETPGGQFLRVDGLSEKRIEHLVAIRDALLLASAEQVTA